MRKSLQGLDYFAAEGSRAFDDLASIVQEIALLRADGVTWGPMIQESLKAGKLYLKSDCKVCHTNSNTRLYTQLTLTYGHSNSFCVRKREQNTNNKVVRKSLTKAASSTYKIAAQVITSNGTVISLISLAAVLGLYHVEIYTAGLYFCNLCPFSAISQHIIQQSCKIRKVVRSRKWMNLPDTKTCAVAKINSRKNIVLRAI